MIIHSQDDRVVPFHHANDLAEAIPNAELVPFHGDHGGWFVGELGVEYAALLERFLGEPDSLASDSTTSSSFRTILFTDVVSSTPLLAHLKDERMRSVMREHDEVLEAAVAEHNGRVVKTVGDAFMAEFAVPSAAVEAAIAARRGSRDRFADSDVPIQLRIGINAGEPIEEDGDLHGASVVIAKRLESEADVSGILVSEVVRQAVVGKSFAFEDRGEVTLKSFSEPVRAWNVALA